MGRRQQIDGNLALEQKKVIVIEAAQRPEAQKRPDFQRLLSDCRRGRVDKILVKSISRFARNATDCLETIRELKAIGVGVCFEEQGIDTSEMTGELLTAMCSAIAQKESESISGNMRWSYQHRMKSGNFITCKAPFGYRLKIELNKRISDINDQDRMLADMNRCGLVDPDIFISRSNELAQQLRAAKQEKDRILGAERRYHPSNKGAYRDAGNAA